jgi:hypothetical protein
LQHIRIMLLHSQFGSPLLRLLDNRPLVVVVQVRIRYPLNSRVGVRARRKEWSTQYRSYTSTVSPVVSLSAFRTLSTSERLSYSYELARADFPLGASACWQTPANCPSMIPPSCCRGAFRLSHLLADSCDLPVHDFSIIVLPPRLSTLPSACWQTLASMIRLSCCA